MRKAAEEVIKVAETATPRGVIEIALAISMMEELDRRRFRSDSVSGSSSFASCVRLRM